MKSYLDFLESRKKTNDLLYINEGFNEKDVEKMIDLISKSLSTHIEGLVPLEGYAVNVESDKKLWSKQYMVIKNPNDVSMFQINFLNTDKTNNAYSIDFFKDLSLLFDGKAKADLSISTLGSSIVYFLPIIWTVASSGNYNLTQSEAIELGRSIFKSNDVKESFAYVGALRYRIIEGLTVSQVDESFADMDDELRDFKRKKQKENKEAWDHRNDSPEAKERFKKINKEYTDIRNAIKGGASTIDELRVALSHNVNVVADSDDNMKEAEEEFKKKHDDPDLVFKKLKGYVQMVIDGTNPSIIVCGAPGVGKTFRVRQQLKAAGYHEGHNLFTIKGKCTPRALYTALYDYKKKGEIIMIDDADGLVGPKAPEDCINILKGALDSTSDDDGRLVTYGIAGKLLDDEGEPLPKRFYYNGSIIVLTNYNAGQLNTALRGRSFLQDINFDTNDVLEIIKKIMPAIDPNHLSSSSKIKAYDYLKELANDKAKMEISIRTFGICAKIYESCGKSGLLSEDEIRSMISEQMELQAKRGGRQY